MNNNNNSSKLEKDTRRDVHDIMLFSRYPDHIPAPLQAARRVVQPGLLPADPIPDSLLPTTVKRDLFFTAMISSWSSIRFGAGNAKASGRGWTLAEASIFTNGFSPATPQSWIYRQNPLLINRVTYSENSWICVEVKRKFGRGSPWHSDADIWVFRLL